MGVSHRFSRAVVERLRIDFQKAVRTSGVLVDYKILKQIVEFGSSSYSMDDAVEQDPLYPQPAFVGSVSDDKLYTEINLMAIVNQNPRQADLRALGLDKKTDLIVTIAAKTIEENSIIPDEASDRIDIAGVEYDIIDLTHDWLVEGDTGLIKNLCWNFGCIKRSGRI
jgi:hypothetical protein